LRHDGDHGADPVGGRLRASQHRGAQRRAEQRLRQLAESEQSARREAELANRTKDHFLAVLSHELRTPLTPVLLILSLLKRRDDLPNDLKEDLQTIERNVELEARLIDDLLDLTRVARGKLQLSRETTDVHALMIRAWRICGRPEGVKVDVDLSATRSHGSRRSRAAPAGLLESADQRAQVHAQGGRIAVRSINPQTKKIRFEVSDTGIGIDPQLLPKLFNAFRAGR
jgi:signal transduction histidine kinase